MSEINMRSIRILTDLQACQTQGSAKRGVGRYSESLFKAMIRQSGARHVHGMLSKQHKIFPELKGVPTTQIVYANALPDIETPRFYAGGEQDVIDSILTTNCAASVAPDVIHVSHIFEGFSDRVSIPLTPGRSGGQVLSATLYDLIPLRFSEIYFQSEEYKRWYYSRLNFYRQTDLLLAISEASRQDAIEFLGIHPEKIVTIMGGVDEHFKPPKNHDKTKARLIKKYKLKRPGVVLYTGGDDHRKNLLGALKAYALLQGRLRQKNQLVVICALENHRREFFLNEARKVGLHKEEVCFLGFIPEDDLVGFYGTCDVFFFPSWYEGLGFPVIEAMACGAPTLCGNNSSLRELVDRQDATFDSKSSESIASRLEAALENKAFANELKQYGIERAKLFTWKNAANKALEAFDEALAKKRNVLTLAAASGVLPNLRMAMLTPLPPTRSGIADYNAHFLPYLSTHFNIDIYIEENQCSDLGIKSSFRVFSIADFRKNATSYDVILYELGNSEFHSHMLPLLEEYPGVVGLHDAFLSGLMGYLEINLGNPHRFAQEMIFSHGSIARKLFAPVQENPDAISNAMIDLPCTKSVIDKAIGVISHSKFNLELARDFYPEGWAAPYRIIPQMVKTKGKNTKEDHREAKRELGFDSNAFIITTFGHVAWTKWGDRILQAFLESSLSRDVACHLVFAGELSRDEFGTTLKQAIKKSGVKARITITGYLSNEEYDCYLKATNIAIQLRTNSRGGTPKGVLDCLSAGLPVIVNNAASYEDYPADVVLKLSPEPSPAEIGDAFQLLRKDYQKRQIIADNGFQYVKENHSPEKIAAQYAAAIHEFANRYKSSMPDTFVDAITPHLAGVENSKQLIPAIAHTFYSSPEGRFGQNRLIIDCSHISKNDHSTGIPRVVRETVRETYCSARRGFEALAVNRVGNQIVLAVDWLDTQNLLLPFEVGRNIGKPIEFHSRDTLLMLDSSWQEYNDFEPIFSSARLANVSIVTAIYDLLPIRLSPKNFVPGGNDWFDGWLRKAIAASDGLVCISKSVADDLIAYIEENHLQRPALKVGWWHLGFRPLCISNSSISELVRQSTLKPFCLMVGTIEPRKNHALALDAFEKLWSSGVKINLVFAGKVGWMVDGLLERVLSHEEYGNCLYYIEGPTDTELDYMYKKASMLLFISKGEGFGLPLVEASGYNTPIVCSKISSFEEIGGNHVLYVDIKTADTLAVDLKRCFELISNDLAPKSNKISKLSWSESAEQLLRVVVDQNWYKVY